MFGIFGAKPICPVDPATREWIDRRWAWLEREFGRDGPRKCQVVLPRPEFFPDSFQGTEADAQRMLQRVCGYLGIDPESVELVLYEDRNPVHEGRWRQGTAGLYEEQGKFRIWVEAANLDDPLTLVATLAHELGHVHLLGHRRISPEADDHEPLTDLLTVFLGLGVFTANSVIRERHWHAGEVSMWSMSKSGYLSMPMYGYALALFSRARGEERPAWAKHLRPDVRAALNQATHFLTEGLYLSGPVTSPADAGPPDSTSASDQEERPAPVDDAGDEDADSQPRPVSAAELLELYAAGQRDFCSFDLQGAQLAGADLSGCSLAEADLSGVDLTAATLTGADLRGADIQGATLRSATLRDSDLSGADLSDSDLTDADLSGADLRGADFTGCTLNSTILVDTHRNRSTNFSGQDLSVAKCDPEMNADDLRGASSYQLHAERIERGQRFVAALFFVFLAIPFGALIGYVGGAAIDLLTGDAGAGDVGAVVGAILLPCVAAWQFLLRPA